jgi:hypothetical protein
MKARITEVQSKVLALFSKVRKTVEPLPASELNDLEHYATDRLNAEDCSERMAAEMVRSACALELEKRISQISEAPKP